MLEEKRKTKLTISQNLVPCRKNIQTKKIKSENLEELARLVKEEDSREVKICD